MCLCRRLDSQTISTYPFDASEHQYSLLGCSFSDDAKVYYCVRTRYDLPEENEPTKVSFHSCFLFFILVLNQKLSCE